MAGRPAVVLFDGGVGGYGDAVDVGRGGYAWTYNGDCRALGRAVPSIVPTKITMPAGAIPREVGAAFEWYSSTNQPFILVAGGRIDAAAVKRSVGKIQDGEFGNEDTQTGVPYTGGVLYRNDGVDADLEMAFFCNGAGEDVLRRRNKAGTYSDATSTKADGMAVIGGDLWIWLGYKIAKCTWNADPGVTASYPIWIEVGRPTYPINAVVELGGSPMVLKGDGVFRYNPSPSQAGFHNVASFTAKDPNNGKGGTTDGRGRIYYPTVDSGLLVLTFGAQSQQRPLRENWVDRDSPGGRIGALAAGPEHIYATIDPGSIRTQKLDMVVKSWDDSESKYIDHTVDLASQSYQRTAALGSLSETDDYLYIGAKEPFWGVFAEMQVANAGATRPFSEG